MDQYGVPAHARSYSNQRSTDATSVRIDRMITPKINLFARVAYAPSFAGSRSSTFIGELDATRSYNYTFTAGSSQAFTNKVFNEIHANYTRAGGSNKSTLDITGRSGSSCSPSHPA